MTRALAALSFGFAAARALEMCCVNVTPLAEGSVLAEVTAAMVTPNAAATNTDVTRPERGLLIRRKRACGERQLDTKLGSIGLR